MGLVTYRNNRLVPALIIALCVLSFFYFLDAPSDNYGQPPFEPASGGSYLEVEEYTDVPLPPPTINTDAIANTEAVSTADLIADSTTDSITDSTTNMTPDEVPKTSPVSVKPQSPVRYGDGDGLTPNDVLLIMKTGGTTMWKRLLIHLTTSLAGERIPPENIVIYSDIAEKVGHFTTVDIFANMSETVKNTPDFDVYRQQPEYMANNYYVESSGVAGDEWGPTGGWIVDKYKFVPLYAHAGENWPQAKWYIYMEDDTYLFLPQILAHLSKFDWRRPHYLGSYAAKSDIVFAHGGAGFALSRGAWETSFGKNPQMAEDYHQYTANHCCGDQVLAHALNKYGVKFGENDGDEKFTYGFSPVVHWQYTFERYNWCTPLMSFHKVHSRDVAAYYDLERNWDFSKPLRHKDFFNKMVLSRVQKRMEWWDNMSGIYEVTSANKDAPPAPPDAYDAKIWKKGWESPDACEGACKSWVNCVQWSFVEDLCRLDNRMIQGQGYAPAMSQRKTSLMHTSGWLPERLDEWICE